ncbi:MAG: outer membrane protein assembly factor BamB [Rhodoferax sp.]|nr:MAG: outer membrane protein assembly factor BamB [Rhodoferax sp.]
MNFQSWRNACWVGLLLLVSACSSVDKPKPAALGANPELFGVRKAWGVNIGEVGFPLQLASAGSELAVASGAGTIAVLDAKTGQDVWRIASKEGLAAGVGFDGKRVAVVTRTNALLVFGAGKELWRADLGTTVVTPPLVAGGRVFVLGSDRTVLAFDGATGRMLWQQQRGVDALVLRQPGLLTAVGDTLAVGIGGRMQGLNPLNGTLRWDIAVANSRGSNEVEKLIEIPAGVARDGQQLCVRAYQHSLGCVDTAKPMLQWSKASAGFTGLAGDSETVVGADAQGVISAYKRQSGDSVWTTNLLRYRQLTAPAMVGRSVVIGDADGNVHLLSKIDGSVLTRMTTDGSAIASTPVLAGQTLVVVTQRGGVFGFKPE